MGTDDLFKQEKIEKEKRRQANRDKIKDSILILCEGIKTEPNYFRGFRKNFRLSNVTIDGCGTNTDSLVKTAINNLKNYDQIWCVFDRDSFPKQNFIRAFQLANKYNKKIKIAYSNEAFEIWYLLHFHLRTTAMSRDEFKKTLTNCIKKEYKKNSKEMYYLLLDKQETAIRNAKKLMEHYSTPNPVEDNPSTTVYRLVEELNKYKK